MDRISRPRKRTLLSWGEDVSLDQALQGRSRQVVTLYDLGADADTALQLLLGEEEVCVAAIEVPDPVQQSELGWGIEAQVADELSDVGPVLLFDVRPVVLVARAGSREGDLSRRAVCQQVGVDELRAIV
jgi:hypothetical protein